MKSHPLLAYFALAIGISWLLWLPRIASAQGWIDVEVAEWWHYAGAAGPVTAAVIVASRTEGWSGLHGVLRQYSPSRIRLGWLLGALGVTLAAFAVGLVAHRFVEGGWPSAADLAKTSNLPALGLPLTFTVHVLTFGIGEETGWRGYALPRLQARHSALGATLILSLPWLAWHIPTFFENEDFREMGAVMLVGWAIGLILGAIALTWLYNSSRGSLITVIAWHGLFNTLVASEAAPEVIAPLMTTAIMALAAVGLFVAGPRELTGLSKHSGTRVKWPGRAEV
jgi:uncharacterized protein